MSNNAGGESIADKKADVEELIREVLKKIPEERRIEALRILEGFALNESAAKKAG